MYNDYDKYYYRQMFPWSNFPIDNEVSSSVLPARAEQNKTSADS